MKQFARRASGAALLFAAALVAGRTSMADEPAIPELLRTVAETSGFTQTSTSAEVVGLVDRLCARGPHLERFVFGKTTEGRELVAVKVATPMVASPEDVGERLVVLVIGNIHSGECAGKEALLMLLRDLALASDHRWLESLVLIVAPNYNADGNDKRGQNAEQRPGQVGPEVMGTRANADGLDLNRDFVKLESLEARSLVTLMGEWNPHLFIDCHTTNGSRHRHPLTYDVPHNPAAPKPVRDLLRDRMMPDVAATLEARGISTIYYGNFDSDHAKWTSYGHEPRYSTEYVGLRGRLAILSEAYSYIPYEDRIVASKAFVEACIDWVAEHPDATVAATAPCPVDPVPIGARAEAFEQPLRIRGYEHPAPSGQAPTAPALPKDYEVPFVGRYVPSKTVARPFAYLVPAALSDVAERLRRHGIQVTTLTQPVELEVEVDRVSAATRRPGPFQGHHLVTLTTERRLERRAVPSGAFVIHTSQSLGTLAVYLLEPESDDGFVTWNVFDAQLGVGADFPVLRVPHAVALPGD